MYSKSIVILRAVSSPAVDVKCGVTLGMTPVSLRRFAYRARSRCHSLVFVGLRLKMVALFPSCTMED